MRTGHSEWLCLIILLVQQISVSRPETFQVLGPADPVVAVAGEDTVLPCHLSPRISAEGLEIRWFRDERSEPVFLYRKQRPELQDQVLTYRGRAALFPEELSKGNTSLQLTRVRGSDHGRYRCVVESLDWYDDTVFEVDVRAVGTQAAISLETHQGQGVRLGCESKGWFPEPEVVWLDSEGQSLTADPTETHRDSQDLFTVRRQVTVQHSATNRFTCRVEQQQLNQVREAEIDVPRSAAAERDTLSAENNKLSTQNNALNRKIDTLDREKRELTKKLESASKEKDTLTRKIDALDREKRELKEKLESASIEKDTLNREKYTLNREKYALNREIGELTKKLESASKEKDTLNREKYALDREKRELTKKLESASKEKDTLDREKRYNEDQEEDSSSSPAKRTTPGSSSRSTDMKYGYRRY